jgi:hypothetical protein
MTKAGKPANAALAVFHMDLGVDYGGDGVSEEWRQEDQGNDGVCNVIVVFEVGQESAICTVIEPEDEEGPVCRCDPKYVLSRMGPGLELAVLVRM